MSAIVQVWELPANPIYDDTIYYHGGPHAQEATGQDSEFQFSKAPAPIPWRRIHPLVRNRAALLRPARGDFRLAIAPNAKGVGFALKSVSWGLSRGRSHMAAIARSDQMNHDIADDLTAKDG